MRLLVRVLTVLLIGAAVSLANRSPAHAGPTLLAGFPLLRQQHSLTCESSAVSMATRAQIMESQIMAVLPRHPNPNMGFRGNVDGQQGTKLVDYGVYAAPLHAALLRFGFASDVIQYGADRDIKGYVNRGWPVVAWVTYGLQKSRPRLAQYNGVQFFLVPHEHAITVVGYDNGTVIANDPWTAKQVRYYWKDFNRSWGYFGNMALAVEPCPAALPVTRIRVAAISSTTIRWTWPRVANAAHYAVTVTFHGARTRVEYSGTQDDHQFVLANPTPGVAYEISVRSVSACGDLSEPVSLWIQLPPLLATPTPVEATAVVAPTATPTTTPTPTSTPKP